MEIFIILLLILLNGLFAMSEIALISARKSNLTAQAKQGNKRARQALKLAEDPNKFLSTVQIGITLIGILTGIYSGAAIADDLREVFVRWGVPYAAPVAQTLIVIVVTYLTIVFGELIPKRIGMTAAEPVAKLVAGPMKVLSVVASPFVWLLSKSIEGISRLFGLRDTDSPVTEAEIKSIVQEGAEDGAVQAVEQKIVGRVFSLGDRSVESIMTHRSDIAWLDVNMSVDEIRDLVRREPHGRYPVGRIARPAGRRRQSEGSFLAYRGPWILAAADSLSCQAVPRGSGGVYGAGTVADRATGLWHRLRRVRRHAGYRDSERYFRSPCGRAARRS